MCKPLLTTPENDFTKVRKNIFSYQKEIKFEDRLIVLTFIAAMLSRTKTNRDLLKKQWKDILEMGLDMKDYMKNTSIDKRNAIPRFFPSSSKKDLFSLNDVQKIAEQPSQEMLYPQIDILTGLLMLMNLSIFCTKNDIGFITSDDPCVRFDPEAYKIPAFYRYPGLAYKTIEITLPISPNQMAFLTWHPLDLYINVNDKIIDDFNSRTRFFSSENFVVKRNFTKPIWFENGKPPEGWVE